MIFKCAVGVCVCILACASALASASDTTVLPETFEPAGDVLVCPESDEQALEYIIFLVTGNAQALGESTCSLMPKNQVRISSLETPLLLQVQNAEMCGSIPCVDAYTVGIYTAVVYGRIAVYAIGPEPIDASIQEVRRGFQAGVKYRPVPSPSLDQYELTALSLACVTYL